MVNYQKGKIYKIFDKHNPHIFFVGSTCQALSTRMAKHRKDCRKLILEESPPIFNTDKYKWLSYKLALNNGRLLIEEGNTSSKQYKTLEQYRNLYNFAYINKDGWENLKIKLIKDVPCENREQLLREEDNIIQELQPLWNDNMLSNVIIKYYINYIAEYERDIAARGEDSYRDYIAEYERIEAEYERIEANCKD